MGTNDTALLQHPYFTPNLTSVPFNYSGYGVGLPICFSKGTSQNFTGCLPTRARTITRTNQRVIVTLPPDGINASSSVTPPQTVDPCEKETRTSNKTALWRNCYIEPWRYPVPGFNRSFVDWSGGNGTHQNPGQLGFSHRPMVG